MRALLHVCGFAIVGYVLLWTVHVQHLLKRGDGYRDLSESLRFENRTTTWESVMHDLKKQSENTATFERIMYNVKKQSEVVHSEMLKSVDHLNHLNQDRESLLDNVNQLKDQVPSLEVYHENKGATENVNQENVNKEIKNQENMNQENVNQENINQENVNQEAMNQESINRENANQENVKEIEYQPTELNTTKLSFLPNYRNPCWYVESSDHTFNVSNAMCHTYPCQAHFRHVQRLADEKLTLLRCLPQFFLIGPQKCGM